MAKSALLVVDMLKDFLDPHGALYVGDVGLQIIPFVADKITEMRRQGGVIIFLCDSHAPDDPEFALFPAHCVRGTWGAEIIPPLAIQPGDYLVEKKHLSGFYGTELDNLLTAENITEVHLVGVCTSICIMETASDLLNRYLPTVVYRQGVADSGLQDHEWALKRMARVLGAKVV